MELYYIPMQDCGPLRKVLFQEFMRRDNYSVVETICSRLSYMVVSNVVSNNLLNCLSTIITDNLVRVVVEKNPIELVEGMSSGNLVTRMIVSHRHFVDLVSENIAAQLEDDHIEQLVIRDLSAYLEHIYLGNKTELDTAILHLFNVIYNNLGHLPIRTYRSAVLPDGNLGVLVSRGIDENNLAYG